MSYCIARQPAASSGGVHHVHVLARPPFDDEEVGELPVDDRRECHEPEIAARQRDRPHPQSVVARDPDDLQRGEAVAADAAARAQLRQGGPAAVVVEHHRQAGEAALHLTQLSDLGNPPAVRHAGPPGERIRHSAPPADAPSPGRSVRIRCEPVSTRAVRRLPP